jgi:hypothetical protein
MGHEVFGRPRMLLPRRPRHVNLPLLFDRRSKRNDLDSIAASLPSSISFIGPSLRSPIAAFPADTGTTRQTHLARGRV